MTGNGGTRRMYEARGGGFEAYLPLLDVFLAGVALALAGLSAGSSQGSGLGAAACVLAALNASIGLRRASGNGVRLRAPLILAVRAVLGTVLLVWAVSLLGQGWPSVAPLAGLEALPLLGGALTLAMLGKAALARPASDPVAPATANGDGPVSLESPPRVSVVIPALNEAENLRHVLPRLPQGLHEVILVDGHSTDGTSQVAVEEYPSIRIVAQSGRGKGDAFQAGFAAVTGEIIVMLDADGSADPAEIPRFVDCLIRGADFAKGSRYIEGGGSADLTMIRQLGNWALSRTANLLYGTRYTDLCYGYNAFWVQCLPYLSVDVAGFEVETLLNVRVAKAGLQVAEVPSFEAERIHGDSHLRTFRDGFRVLRTMVRELPLISATRGAAQNVRRRAMQPDQEAAQEQAA
jgi:hypothetical protein